MLIINRNVDPYAGSIAEVMSDAYVASKTKVGVENIVIKLEGTEEFVDVLRKFHGYKEYKFNSKSTGVTRVLESDVSIIFITSLKNENTSIVNVYHQSYEDVQEIYQLTKKYTSNDEVVMRMTNIFKGRESGILSDYVEKRQEDFVGTTSKYYPYLDVNEMFEQFLHSDSNILFLCGKPGVGKTRLANLYGKFLFEKVVDESTPAEVYNRIVQKQDKDDPDPRETILVFTAKNESLLSLDAFWNEIIRFQPALVFLDDLDFISKRTDDCCDTEKNRFISQFLSFTEGIHKDSNRTKFIITTNRDFSEIDEALLRKGRCFDILNLAPLTSDEAKNIWESEGLDIKLFSDYFSSKEVFQCDLGDAIKQEKTKEKFNLEYKPYLLKDGVSIIKKVNREKKTGFLK